MASCHCLRRLQAEESLQRVRQIFEEVGDELEASGKPYLLGGDAFAGTDMVFSALASLVLLPPNAPCRRGLDPEAMSVEALDVIQELRETRAGRHAMMCYDLHRGSSFNIDSASPPGKLHA